MKYALRTLTIALTILFGLAATTDVNAQDPRRGYGVGVAGQGTDMWTQAMSGLRLFTPHRDNCNATTEVFVKIYANSNNVDFGFCIDKDEHSDGTVHWEDARQACFEDGKRLLEPGEFKYSCQSVTGINNMTDDWEWTSNFWYPDAYAASNGLDSVSATVSGNGTCKTMAHGYIGRQDGIESTRAFRCVR